MIRLWSAGDSYYAIGKLLGRSQQHVMKLVMKYTAATPTNQEVAA